MISEKDNVDIPEFICTKQIFSQKETDHFWSLIKKNQPFILRGYTSSWMSSHWRNLDYLAQQFKEDPLSVDTYATSFYDIHSVTTTQMSFNQYINVLSACSHPLLYLSELELFKNQRHILDHDMGECFYQKKLDSRMFLLGKNTITPMHYHRAYESMIHQIKGQKTLFLSSPKYFYRMKPYPWNSKFPHWSQIQFNAQTPEQFQQAADGKKLYNIKKVLLNEGDSLYIPIYWWHIVFGKEMSLSVVDFFASSFSKKYLTYLGFRSKNHKNLF